MKCAFYSKIAHPCWFFWTVIISWNGVIAYDQFYLIHFNRIAILWFILTLFPFLESFTLQVLLLVVQPGICHLSIWYSDTSPPPPMVHWVLQFKHHISYGTLCLFLSLIKTKLFKVSESNSACCLWGFIFLVAWILFLLIHLNVLHIELKSRSPAPQNKFSRLLGIIRGVGVGGGVVCI